MVKPTRIVTVNVNRWGKVHEPNCWWLRLHLNHGGDPASFKNMPANQVPAGKAHCSHCV